MAKLLFKTGPLSEFPGFQDAWSAFSGEMHRKGWNAGWPAHPRFAVFGIIYNDEVISFISLAEMKDKTVKVAGAWTHPIYRRRGIYDELYRIMVNCYRSDGNKEWLLSGYRKENIASARMQAKQGREIYHDLGDRVQTRISLKPTGDEFPIDSKMLDNIMDAVNPRGDSNE